MGNLRPDERLIHIPSLTKEDHDLGFTIGFMGTSNRRSYLMVMHYSHLRRGTRVADLHLMELRAFNGVRPPEYDDGKTFMDNDRGLKQWFRNKYSEWENEVINDRRFAVNLVVGPHLRRGSWCLLPTGWVSSTLASGKTFYYHRENTDDIKWIRPCPRGAQTPMKSGSLTALTEIPTALDISSIDPCCICMGARSDTLGPRYDALYNNGRSPVCSRCYHAHRHV